MQLPQGPVSLSVTNPRATMKRGELAKSLSCSPETIRFYEKIKLTPPPSRTEGGHRIYSNTDRRRLRFILRCRELGFSIEEIRSLLILVNSGDYTCGQIQDVTQGHLKTVLAKIADMRKIELTLKNILQGCAGGTQPDCPIIEALVED